MAPKASNTQWLTEEHLPGVWKDADAASVRGQRWALTLTASKVGGGVIAAIGSAFAGLGGNLGVASWVVLGGFIVALVSELASWVFQSEKDWYEGRAVAESAKTLAWRYAVCADPFPVVMSREAAEDLFRTRMVEVIDQVSDRIVFESSHAVVTPQMDQLRQLSFVDRQRAYVEGRTLDQHRWYARKARTNRRFANGWRFVLIVAEVAAVTLAVGQVLGAWSIDLAGLLAAIIGAGAAWVAVKQFTPLASAYSVATKELALQEGKLRTVSEERWSYVVADAEEAISREHTTWAASRTGRAAVVPRRDGE
ncbi:DUF4231 domain-containing protein [Brevibacterium aurantiacum]|uniref:DUF4231 domain-containing protein n=1 Tax=Brevibacterium aurantiacum TaxID=273384 RepID=UPI001865F78D|nr:DUF4231 domain-containing protein [Brevibacterium aurantiacum]